MSEWWDWWAYGAFFIVAAAAQVAFAIIVVLEPWRRGWLPDRPPLDHARQRRWAYLAGVLGNVAIIGLYLVTRTIGIPAGPHAGLVEEVMPIDVVSKVSEVGIVICLLRLLRMPVDDRHRSGNVAARAVRVIQVPLHHLLRGALYSAGNEAALREGHSEALTCPEGGAP